MDRMHYTLSDKFGQDAVRVLAVAVALIEERERILNRALNKAERDWLVRKAFVHQRGSEIGGKIADCVIQMMNGLGWRT